MADGAIVHAAPNELDPAIDADLAGAESGDLVVGVVRRGVAAPAQQHQVLQDVVDALMALVLFGEVVRLVAAAIGRHGGAAAKDSLDVILFARLVTSGCGFCRVMDCSPAAHPALRSRVHSRPA